MWSTIAAALKKIAVAILSNKKLRNKVCIFILSVTVAFFMPIIAVLAIFSGKIEFTDEQIQQVVDNIDEEELEKLMKVQETMDDIEEAMKDADMHDRYEEAQLLYLFALYDYQDEDEFVDRLVGCFEDDQSDYELVENVNDEFDCDIDPAEFSMAASSMRSTMINRWIFADPATKNNTDLVAWADMAYQRQWGYVWGSYGLILSQEYFENLCEAYPTHVENYHDFIQENWVGRRTADCAGLIKGYLWYNPDSQQIEYGYGGFTDYGANSMYNAASESGPVSEIPEIPGLGVWHDGHVGIYIGNGYVIQAMGTKYGVVKTKLEGSTFTNWFKIPGIEYPES